uniref:Uncharacterized protein n=1 Tax=Arundo donax TaxID=35708 RepID=A0A0A9BYD3_ARUDO
MPAGPTPS